MALFNIITADKCCSKKHSALKTGVILGVFTVVFLMLCGKIYLWTNSFTGNAAFFLIGFAYLLPFVLLYEEKLFKLFVIMCMCWSYTMGILSLSMQLAGILERRDDFILVFVIQNLFYLATAYPFYRIVVPKYVFVLQNIEVFGQRWYKYLAMSSCLSFFTLAVINIVFNAAESSLSRVLVLILLLASVYVVYFILYGIVLDSVNMNHLEYAALHDPLTGLGNRARLLEDLNAVIEAEQTFSVLFLDLDRFKQINDQYGHMIGDQYLIHFAKICTDMFREHGRVYRFGGDEFVILYFGAVSRQEIDSLKECRQWQDGAPCPFNQVSVGTLICRPPHRDVEYILHQADEIMYRNKELAYGKPAD